MSKVWSIPPMWEGKTVVILASGPSMTSEIAGFVRGLKLPTVSINSTYKIMPDTDLLYAADKEWWATNPAAMDIAGLKVSCTPVPGVRRLLNLGSQGWSDDRMGIHTYGNSGAQAIQIAVKAGAARVLLCGYDMRPGHWHGPHPAPLRNPPKSTYQRWVILMRELAGHLRGRCEVINCTPGSALDCFESASIWEVLSGSAKKHINAS